MYENGNLNALIVKRYKILYNLMPEDDFSKRLLSYIIISPKSKEGFILTEKYNKLNDFISRYLNITNKNNITEAYINYLNDLNHGITINKKKEMLILEEMI
jgi:hypothetical protein